MAVIPAWEFDFPPTKAQRPTPPCNIDTQVLWDGFAQLYERLGKFGAQYKQVHGVLQGWRPKLDTLAEIVVDMHHKQNVLASRFLDLEGQNPVGHIHTLFKRTDELHKCFGEIEALQRDLGGWAKWGGGRWTSWPHCLGKLPKLKPSSER